MKTAEPKNYQDTSIQTNNCQHATMGGGRAWRLFLFVPLFVLFLVGRSEAQNKCFYSLGSDRAERIQVFEVNSATGVENPLGHIEPGGKIEGQLFFGTRLRLKIGATVIQELIVPNAPAAKIVIPAGGAIRAAAPRPGPAARGTGSKVTPEEARAIIAVHNRARAEVGVGPVEWSNDIAAYAQAWADHLKSTAGQRAKDDVIVHRSENRYGENLAAGTRMDGVSACNSWLGEKKVYNHSRVDNPGAGHYTQMVWRASKKIGMGKATFNGWTIYVCNYDPPGNYIGQKPY